MPQDDSDNEYEREENMMENIRKTYLVTDTLITKLPVDFVFSTNKRYIEIQNCKVVDLVHNNAPNNVCMHINLLHDRQYLDNNVGLVNFIKTKYKRYEVKGNEEELIIWFTQERGAPDHIDNPVIHNFPDKTYPKFEDFDYSKTPYYDDIKHLFDFLKIFFEEDCINHYQNSTTNLNVHERLEYYKAKFYATPFENDVLELWADESYYTNDYLLDKIEQIYQWSYELDIFENYYSSIVQKFVWFFTQNFKNILSYDYVDVFGNPQNMTTVGACLAAYIYNDYNNYVNANGVIEQLDNSGLDFSDPDTDNFIDFVMYTECVDYYNDNYGTHFTTGDWDTFTAYWSMIDLYAQKYNLDYNTLIQLAFTMDTLPDFSRANINILLGIIGKQPGDFTLYFSDALNVNSVSYLFIELCNLMGGHFSTEPLKWHEYSFTKAPGLITAIEITFDPFYPEWCFEREVEYRELNPFPEEQYVVNAITGDYEAQYRFMAEFMLIF